MRRRVAARQSPSRLGTSPTRSAPRYSLADGTPSNARRPRPRARCWRARADRDAARRRVGLRRRARGARAALRRRRLPLRLRVLLDLLPQRVRVLLLPRRQRREPALPQDLDEVVAICRDLAASGRRPARPHDGRGPRASTTSPATPALLELVAAVCDEQRAAGHGLARRAARRRRWPVSAPAAPTGTRCYQETHTPELYERLRVGQPFAARAAARSAARRAGLLVEDGLLTGIGDTAPTAPAPSSAMRDAGVGAGARHDVRAAGGHAAGRRARRPATLASCSPSPRMRLAMPERSDPGVARRRRHPGLERAPRGRRQRGHLASCRPPSGLAGVSQAELDIDEGLADGGTACCRTSAAGAAPGRRSPSTASWLARGACRASEVRA